MASCFSLTSPLMHGTGSEKDVKSLLAMHLSSCRMFSVSVYFTSVKIYLLFFISYKVLMLEGAKSKFGVLALLLRQEVSNARILYCLFLTLRRIVQISLHCYPSTFPHSLSFPTTLAFIILWNELLYSLCFEIRVSCYQPYCYKCFHLAMIFKFVTARIFLQSGKQMAVAR